MKAQKKGEISANQNDKKNSKNSQSLKKGESGVKSFLSSAKGEKGIEKSQQNASAKAKQKKSFPNHQNNSMNIQKSEIKPEKSKAVEISGKSELDFSTAKFQSKNIIVALLVFVLSVFSVASIVLAGNFFKTPTILANVTNTRIVQAKLASLGYYDGEIDGIFDEATIDAIKNYQSDKDLTVTGNLDSSTTTALGVTDNAQANTDLYLLAKLIYSEARGEVYEGQVAVGAVVLNRVDDAGFPNTLQGVIYQPWAFTALHDGQFALEPNSTAYQAAQDAMNGWDPTYGCLYYYNPATATSSWIFSRTIVVTIGNHVFCY